MSLATEGFSAMIKDFPMLILSKKLHACVNEANSVQAARQCTKRGQLSNLTCKPLQHKVPAGDQRKAPPVSISGQHRHSLVPNAARWLPVNYFIVEDEVTS